MAWAADVGMERGIEVSRKAFQKALEAPCNIYRASSGALAAEKHQKREDTPCK